LSRSLLRKKKAAGPDSVWRWFSGGHATIYSEIGHGTTINLYFSLSIQRLAWKMASGFVTYNQALKDNRLTGAGSQRRLKSFAAVTPWILSSRT
jgi:hypothetical protein